MNKEIARVAVVGAGLIGQRHCRAVQMADGVTLSAVVDPSDAGRGFADSIGATWFADLSDMIAADGANGVLLATPNTMHAVSLLKRLIAPVAIGALSGMALAQVMESAHMMAVFGVLGTCVGLYMVLSPSVAREGATLPRAPVTFASATVFGGLSALMGIGGGSFFVPFLSYFGKSTHQAVATSSGIGMLIAIPSAIGFMIVPTPVGAPPLMLGQVNLGAVFIIACTTFVFAPLGAALAHKLDSKKLKRVFGVFLIFTALRMLTKAIAALS